MRAQHRDDGGDQGHDRRNNRGVSRGGALQRECDEDRPAKDSTHHGVEQRLDLVASWPRHPAYSEDDDGERGRDHRATGSGEDRCEALQGPDRPRQGEGEADDSEQGNR